MILLLLACQAPADAPVDTTELTWAEDTTLDADYTVPEGTTLTLEPGVAVTVATGVALVIEGEFVARGTEAEPIVFTGEAWGGIRFVDSAVDATFDGVDVYSGGSIVEHAVIERATRGMDLAGASPYLHAVTFRDNELPTTVDTVGGAGLLVRGGATPRIRACTFTDNVSNLFAFGGALYVDQADPIVQDSVFTDNVSSYGGAIATNLMASPIVGSWFEGNESASEGGAISLVSSVSVLLADTMTGNLAEDDGGGLHVCVTCIPHSAPSLYDLVVTDNVSNAAEADGGAAGIGAAFLGSLRSSQVTGNLRDGTPSDFAWFNLSSEGWPDWVAQPDLTDVWWGTDDLAAIDATVWDGVDSARYGVVTLDPPRARAIDAPVARAVLTTREQHYADAGDDVAVFLTLYNPGATRTVTLAITRAGAPWTGDLAYPEASSADGAWTIEMPENSAWFGTIEEGTYDGTTVDDVTWTATLSDDDGVIGEASAARYVSGP